MISAFGRHVLQDLFQWQAGYESFERPAPGPLACWTESVGRMDAAACTAACCWPCQRGVGAEFLSPLPLNDPLKCYGRYACTEIAQQARLAEAVREDASHRTAHIRLRSPNVGYCRVMGGKGQEGPSRG
jgi:hypothetical protein